ncbi:MULTISPECIES: DUF502 domain-containing protein [Priestia]|jgi:uncharacterized membrane protein|uniref:DUF502 domain-containing protein n=1 Tax=Priestia megaterium TaxID=1404 RepID=A0A1Q8UK53_PRIMG|nr:MULTISPECIES: DUF502 domain-containing protein [Priestia]RFB22933.1 DUF502 domain-containing protein [Bacillus sp. ALD]RFB35245.1 DUF502 domain-containing protein [Bacillus sp. RC]AUO11706.1 DUF502 domain-containing protein [Priestia megaterium]MBM6598162.1 DUF502 domain-containing protein [Priestia megaterium]MBV6737032.1 DUF502 domain-containing protein [Priestia megaterium]
MKAIIKSFINGLLTIVPIILVIYILVRVFNFLDSILGNVLKPYMKQDYIPGVGILATLVLITFLGWLSTRFFAGKIINLIDRLLERIPLVKTLYTVIKDTFQSFLGEKKSFSKVVLVTMPGTSMKVIGFVTSEEVEEVIHSLKDHFAVYVPQTFQVAGFTFLIPKEEIEWLDIKPEEAMKFVLSGGVSSSKAEK